ncbi:MAG: three-Cys-motif partner protein TcmP [Gammaproteobacteria bacterium]|nr:three-Cys-motif partner protein TcmP [Gammaproteobacteria bacterium]
MNENLIPSNYIGKEQAYVKHTILRTYLQRLFMIVGQSRQQVFNYVDCFSGPWQESDTRLSDTSIGISLEQMAKCQEGLEKQFGRKVTFRALYVEKDPVAYKKLQNFLSENPYPNIVAESINGDFSEKTSDIISWCGSNFSFFFVDPTGWKNVVGIRALGDLLALENSEFLINLMYDFINRFISLEKHAGDMIDLFGEVPNFTDEEPYERQSILLGLYRKNLKNHYGGRTAYVPIEKRGKDRVHYYLVYLTRHSTGLDVFKTEAEKMNITQRIVQNENKLRQQIGQSPMEDLFGVESRVGDSFIADDRPFAKEYLLKRLSSSPILIDAEIWADFLEETDLYPKDFQMAMKELIKENLVVNLDADVSRRRTKIIKPKNNETWSLKD